VPPADSRPLLVALRPLGLGDLLTAVPALRALARAFPEHERVLAAPAQLAPLAIASGAVDRVVDTRALEDLPAELHGADIAVDLHGKGPESHRVLLAAKPRRLIAFRNEEVPESRGMPAWRPDEHEVVRWCRLLGEQGIPAPPDDLYLDCIPAAVPACAVGATVIHPGAASGARRWPLERFAAVARSETEAGRRIVITGSAAEVPLAEEVARLAEQPVEVVAAGRTDLPQLAAIVSAAARVVSGDTGVAHLAVALGTPSVTVFGPTSPALWGPPAGNPCHCVLWAGHTGDPHASAPEHGLLAIRAEDVVSALAELERRPAAA
jgi:ADP-heptose:LPS heptosyltransferase